MNKNELIVSLNTARARLKAYEKDLNRYHEDLKTYQETRQGLKKPQEVLAERLDFFDVLFPDDIIDLGLTLGAAYADFLLSSGIVVLLDNKLSQIGMDYFVMIIIIWLCLLVVLHRVRRWFKQKKLNKAVEQDNQQRIAFWEEHRAENEQKIRLLSPKLERDKLQMNLSWKYFLETTEHIGLHRTYHTDGALLSLIIYLETGRADTLKEALNLYEADQAQEMRDAEEREHRQKMEQQAAAIYEETVRGTQAAEAAARSADEAAFWGAAATLAASSKKQSGNNDWRIV